MSLQLALQASVLTRRTKYITITIQVEIAVFPNEAALFFTGTSNAMTLTSHTMFLFTVLIDMYCFSIMFLSTAVL